MKRLSQYYLPLISAVSVCTVIMFIQIAKADMDRPQYPLGPPAGVPGHTSSDEDSELPLDPPAGITRESQDSINTQSHPLSNSDEFIKYFPSEDSHRDSEPENPLGPPAGMPGHGVAKPER